MDILEAFEEPGFYILGGGGVIAEVLGFVFAKRAGFALMPVWQLIVMMVGTLVAAAFFATKD